MSDKKRGYVTDKQARDYYIQSRGRHDRKGINIEIRDSKSPFGELSEQSIKDLHDAMDRIHKTVSRKAESVIISSSWDFGFDQGREEDRFKRIPVNHSPEMIMREILVYADELLLIYTNPIRFCHQDQRFEPGQALTRLTIDISESTIHNHDSSTIQNAVRDLLHRVQENALDYFYEMRKVPGYSHSISRGPFAITWKPENRAFCLEIIGYCDEFELMYGD